jgi:hypothetical protein
LPTNLVIEKAVAKADGKKRGGAANAGDDKSEGEEEEEESAAGGNGVTAEMKYEFIDKVKKLTNEGLTQMVHHIQSLIPASISDLENDKI